MQNITLGQFYNTLQYVTYIDEIDEDPIMSKLLQFIDNENYLLKQANASTQVY